MFYCLIVDVGWCWCVVLVYGVDWVEYMWQCFEDIVLYLDWMFGMDIVIDFLGVECIEVDVVDMFEIVDFYCVQCECIGKVMFILVGIMECCGFFEKIYSIVCEFGGNCVVFVFDFFDEVYCYLDGQQELFFEVECFVV